MEPIKANEISDIIRQQIENFEGGVTVTEVGTVIKVGEVLFGEFQKVKEGDTVKRTGRIMEVPVGDALIGRVVNALGQPEDDRGPILTNHFNPIERIAPGVVDRQP